MDYDWLLGLGIVFGFGILIAYYVDLNLENFLGFSTMFCSFTVYMELLPTWVLVFMLLSLFLIIIIDKKKGDL